MTITLENYRTFENTADLNEAIRLHLREHRYELNETAIRTLEAISRHAVKYAGAAWLKIDTLAGLIGKSKPTARRAVALLERLGIIERVAFMRPVNGGNGGNILRIVPAEQPDDRPEMIAREDAEKPVVPTDESANSRGESTNSKNLNSFINNTYQPSAPVSFYQRFKSFIKSTIGEDQKLTSRLFGVYKAHTTILTKYGAYTAEEVEHVGYEALRASIMATKQKNVRNIVGYYNGTLDRMLDGLMSEL